MSEERNILRIAYWITYIGFAILAGTCFFFAILSLAQFGKVIFPLWLGFILLEVGRGVLTNVYRKRSAVPSKKTVQS